MAIRSLAPDSTLSFRASDQRHWRGNPYPLALIFRHFAQFRRKILSNLPKCKKIPCPRLQSRKHGAILKIQMQTDVETPIGVSFFAFAKNSYGGCKILTEGVHRHE